MPPVPFAFHEDLTGRRFMFAGVLGDWPEVLGGRTPEEHVRGRGALLVTDLADAQYLVVGSKRAKGRAETLRCAEKLRAKGSGPEILDNRAFLHLIRPRLEGCAFLLAGALAPGTSLDGPGALVTAIGARLAGPKEDPDFWVVGSRRAKGKTALLGRLSKLQEQGGAPHVLDEGAFLQLVACARGLPQEGFDARALAIELRNLTDPRRVERAIQMLKRERFQLFSEATSCSVRGIVRSQSQPDAFYGCWLDAEGQYGCFDHVLDACMGQHGQMCKHLLVLLLGLVVAQELAPRAAFDWACAASRRKPATDKQPSAELLLRYHGVEAGEQDWRPTQTIPEDFYAL